MTKRIIQSHQEVRHDGVFGMLISFSKWKKLPDLVD